MLLEYVRPSLVAVVASESFYLPTASWPQAIVRTRSTTPRSENILSPSNGVPTTWASKSSTKLDSALTPGFQGIPSKERLHRRRATVSTK
ncbi:hypothetical protein K443DRAFT_612326 [Laccaria amethystina LaAM-08-1]|uniref:Uncharacterized protein n=1 Tax=Laccaria amethystina LaAM-08-1 TaxID=1095629 RepID=A0A0C9XFB6_9AGAR|nr:hypothetical protein K443DRAFT_612326 [Laccaria amethystina LaAM-08-1]